MSGLLTKRPRTKCFDLCLFTCSLGKMLYAQTLYAAPWQAHTELCRPCGNGKIPRWLSIHGSTSSECVCWSSAGMAPCDFDMRYVNISDVTCACSVDIWFFRFQTQPVFERMRRRLPSWCAQLCHMKGWSVLLCFHILKLCPQVGGHKAGGHNMLGRHFVLESKKKQWCCQLSL